MKLNSKTIATCAILLALGLITSAIKIFHMPMGGSITLFSMFFIAFIGYIYGAKVGILVAIAYGLLQFVLNPSFYNIYQLFTDYIFAFGCLGLSGLFSKKKYGLQIGYLVGITGRFVFSTLSGVIFFASYAPKTMHPLVYSAAYNASYIYAEGILTIIIITIPYVNKLLKKLKDYANS